MENKELYIRPPSAYKKLKTAFQTLQPVYVYGVTGYGKTELVRQFLNCKKYRYISCAKGRFSESVMGDEKIIVIDDISFLTDEKEKRQVLNLSRRRDIWLIMIGRSRVPNWLMQVYVKRSILLINEENLALGEKEIEEYIIKCGRRIDRATLTRLHKRIKGHPVAMKLYVQKFDTDIIYDENAEEEIEKDFFAYLEQTVLQQWDRELTEFIMKISIVDSFTEPLAEMVLSRSDIASLIERAESVGNFLRSENGVYRLRGVMKKDMRKLLRLECSREQVNELYYNAGLYYEIAGKYAEALEMYEKCGNNNRISALLMKNADKNPSGGNYYEMRKYYLSLPDEYICSEPKLMAGMSMLYSLMMRPEESEEWYNRLADFERVKNGRQKKDAKLRLIYLDIGLPHRGIRNIAGIFKGLSSLLLSNSISLPEFSVTSNLPSVMNGGKDFCEWSPHDKELALSIGKVVEKALGKYGAGLVNISLGESLFEKGGDSFEIMNLINRGKMQAEAKGKTEMCFAAIAVEAKLNIVHGEIANAEESLLDFRERIIKEKAERLLPNFEAFMCRVALYKGDMAAVEKWLLSAPKEDTEFYIMERLRYMTKARVYIAKGKLSKAISLLQKMLCYGEQYERHYIVMEAKILLAVCLRRMGDKRWKEYFDEAFSQAEKYHFVRLFSLEGAAVWELLKNTEPEDNEFLIAVKKETRQTAQRYPNYLKEHTDSEAIFGENAMRILRFLADGLSYKEIAQRLNLKENTVRYHIKESYKKLGVNGKAEAVMEASRRGLI